MRHTLFHVLMAVTAGGSGHLACAEAPASPIVSHGDTRAPIDRRALVERHAPVLRAFDAESPFSVGNGESAFTLDVTGLQTFPDAFEKTIPLYESA